MAVTDDEQLADRIRMMSLHGLSHDAWGRYSGGGWDYLVCRYSPAGNMVGERPY